MVRLFYRKIPLLALIFMLSSLISLARSIPKEVLIKRGDVFIPPPAYVASGSYSPVRHRSSTQGQSQRVPSNTHNHSDQIEQRSHGTPSIKSHWSGMGDMRKSSLKRTGSQEDHWWQGNHGDGGKAKRKKDETKYNFHSKR